MASPGGTAADRAAVCDHHALAVGAVDHERVAAWTRHTDPRRGRLSRLGRVSDKTMENITLLMSLPVSS